MEVPIQPPPPRRKPSPKMIEDVKMLYDKLAQLRFEGKLLTFSPHCTLEDNKLWCVCKSCKQKLERTAINFALQPGCENDWKTRPAGCERIARSCRKCVVAKHERPERRLKNIISRYKHLTLEWAQAQLLRQGGRGPITNYPLVLSRRSESPFAIGVHAIDNNVEHLPSNCYFEVMALNVPQYEAIPNLDEPWKVLYLHLNYYLLDPTEGHEQCKYFSEQMLKTEEDLGAPSGGKDTLSERHAFLAKYHFRAILMQKIKDSLRFDIKRGLIDKVPKHLKPVFMSNAYDSIVRQFEAQDFRCFYSGVPFTMKNCWARFSLERLNNNLAHFCGAGETPNVAVIIRLLNTTAQMSQKLVFTFYLSQELISRPIASQKVANELLSELESAGVSNRPSPYIAKPKSICVTDNTERRFGCRAPKEVRKARRKPPTHTKLVALLESLEGKLANMPEMSWLGTTALNIPNLELQLKIRRAKQHLVQLLYMRESNDRFRTKNGTIGKRKRVEETEDINQV